jgi:hypothetical protein
MGDDVLRVVAAVRRSHGRVEELLAADTEQAAPFGFTAT